MAGLLQEAPHRGDRIKIEEEICKRERNVGGIQP